MTHKARKRFGQIFLHDPLVIQRIEQAINPRPGQRLVEIGPGEYNIDFDGYGNICDPDFDNNDTIDFKDLARLKSEFFGSDPLTDLDGDGKTDFADLAILKSMFFGAPGPSGLAP